MRPSEIHDNLEKLRGLLPPEGICCASIWSQPDGQGGVVAGVHRRTGVWSQPGIAVEPSRVRIRAWPAPTDAKEISVEGETWEEAFDKARTAIEAWSVSRDLETVHRLALVLIDLAGTGQDITRAALVDAGFAMEQLDRFIVQASQQAHVIVRRASQSSLAQLRLA